MLIRWLLQGRTWAGCRRICWTRQSCWAAAPRSSASTSSCSSPAPSSTLLVIAIFTFGSKMMLLRQQSDKGLLTYDGLLEGIEAPPVLVKIRKYAMCDPHCLEHDLMTFPERQRSGAHQATE